MRFAAFLALGAIVLVPPSTFTTDVSVYRTPASTTEVAFSTISTTRLEGDSSEKLKTRRKKVRKVKRRKFAANAATDVSSVRSPVVLKKRKKILERKHNKTPETLNFTFIEMPGVVALRINLEENGKPPEVIQRLAVTTSSVPTAPTVTSPRSNLCPRNNGGCSHVCDASHGKVSCSCFAGFTLSSDQRTCEDVDECASGAARCSSSCTNAPGSYSCSCPSGYRLADDGRSCDDVDECLLRNGHGLCQDECSNTPGSYACACGNLPGTRLSADDGKTCEDLDECADGNAGCSHSCIDAFGRAFCACPAGFSLGPDWRTCRDVNECEQRACAGTCLNTEGSYRCLSRADFQDDQSGVTCPPLFPPAVGYVSCSKTRGGGRRSVNAPGTLCRLVCPRGFELRGRYRYLHRYLTGAQPCANNEYLYTRAP